MKYLFVHQNFPGQFYYILQHLAASGEHDICFITEPNPNVMRNVRKVPYNMPRGGLADVHPAAHEFDVAMVRADVVAQRAAALKQLGFVPDVIIGHHGWGELLNMQDVLPGVPLIGYFEFYYHCQGIDVVFDPEFPVDLAHHARIRARNNINHLALTNPGFGQTPTQFQLGTYPDWARRNITVVPEGIHLDACKPDPTAKRRPFRLGNFEVAPRDMLLTFVARNLEPYRGFHTIMRSLVQIQKARRDVKAILVGGDEISYGAPPEKGGSWREVMLREVGDQLDLSRICFPGKIEYADYLRMMQRSDVHAYMSYPFVASWSLRESLGLGCMVVGSDTPTVTEFVHDGETGLIADMRDPGAYADRVLLALEDRALARKLRANARKWAEKNLRMEDHIAALQALMDRAIASR